MENLNLNLNQQAAVNLANLQQLNLKDDVFINQQLEPTKPQYIDINSQITYTAVTSAESLLNEPNKSVKTPISLLQEIMTKCSLPPPVYEEVSTEGHSHMTVFCFRVVIHMSNNDIIAVAKGHSKKKAKHAAAFEVITQLRNQSLPVNKSLAAKFDNLLSSLRQSCMEETRTGLNNTNNTTQSTAVDSAASYAESLDADNFNPVGELIELTQKFSLRPPEFLFGDEVGPSHDKQFTCQAKFSDLKVEAIGRSKKSAKRAAATMLLQKLKEDSNFQTKVETEGNVNEISYNLAKIKEKSNGKKTVDTIQQLKVSNRDAVKLLAKTTNLNELNSKFLHQLSKEENFQYKFYKINPNDEYQRVFLNLFMVPVMAFFGKGKTYQDAVEDATKSALEAIQIFCSRNI